MLDKLLQILFPEYCLGCDISGTLLCSKCVKNLERSTHEDDVISIFSYRDPLVRKIVQVFKYGHKKILGTLLGKLLAEELIAELENQVLFENFKNTTIVPIPISRRRLRMRGFNQSEILAQELYTNLDSSVFSLDTKNLIRIRETESQTKTTSKKERLANPKDSFGIKNPNSFLGKNIILVDDVWTTGATLREASKVLKKAGVKKIIMLTIAH